MNLLKKIYQTTWNWQLRSHLDNCAWALVKAGYVIGIVHSTFGIFSSPQYIMFMFSFSRFFRSVTLWCFLSLILSDEDKIELAVINPAYVMGPVINGSMSTSSEVSRSTKQKKQQIVYHNLTRVCRIIYLMQWGCVSSTFLASFDISFSQHSSLYSLYRPWLLNSFKIVP